MYSHKDKYIESIANGANQQDLEDELLLMMEEEWMQHDELTVLEEYTHNVEMEDDNG